MVFLATGNGTFNNGQMNGSGGSGSNFPSVGNFEIGTFNISNSRGGGNGKSKNEIPTFQFIYFQKVKISRKLRLLYTYLKKKIPNWCRLFWSEFFQLDLFRF